MVSRATRDQADPLAPAGRHFGNFVFAIFPLGANAGARAFGANAGGGAARASAAQPGNGQKDQRKRVFVNLYGAAVQPRGHRQSMALKDQAFRAALAFFAPNPRARGARRHERRRSAERPTNRWSADQPARAGWAALRQFRLSDIPLGGERWSSGVRGERSIMRPRASTAQPGKGQKDQRKRVFVNLYGAAVQPRGHRQSMALKDQRYRAALPLLAPNPRARGARRPERRRSAERPTFRWSAARPAIQADSLAPPAGRRLNLGWGLVRPRRRRAGERWRSGVGGER